MNHPTHRHLKAGLLLVLTMLAFSDRLCSQDAGRLEPSGPAAMLASLREGTLVVRLQSNARKIQELEKALSDTLLGGAQRQRLQDMLSETQAQTPKESRDIMKAFDGNYNFSKVLFFYDTASVRLLTGEKQGYFLNRDLQVDSSLSLEGEDWLMIYFRHQSPSLFKLLDNRLQPVRQPFPLPGRPFFRSYQLGAYFGGSDSVYPWVLEPEDLAKGFSSVMFYHPSRQAAYFATCLRHWNDRLHKKYRR
jgi:hypothetical protein